MKKTISLSFVFVVGVVLSLVASAQSIDSLLESYSGNAYWENQSGTLHFTSSGVIDFDRSNGYRPEQGDGICKIVGIRSTLRHSIRRSGRLYRRKT